VPYLCSCVFMTFVLNETVGRVNKKNGFGLKPFFKDYLSVFCLPMANIQYDN